MTQQHLDARLPLPDDASDMDGVVAILHAGREEILSDWLDRVRDNRAVEAGQALSDPLLLDHVPQLFDAMLDRLAVNRSRDDAEQLATIHGFTRRLSGYDVVETVIELLMFRRSIWAQLTAVEAPVGGAYLAMERIDGMVDRAVITSLRAFLDPGARMLRHVGPDGEPGGAYDGIPDPSGPTP
jgi:hypothetical protein